jgi:hypothetical protein
MPAVQYHSIGRREEIQAKAWFTLRARLDKIERRMDSKQKGI